MHVLVTIRPLGAKLIGAALNITRPPSSNIIHGIEYFFRRLLYEERRGETFHLANAHSRVAILI
jgi:hypothetical protein